MNMKTKVVILISLVLVFIFTSNKLHSQRWTAYRWDVTYGAGTTIFLGDLGGGPGKPSHFFSVRDIDYSKQRPVVNVGIRYKLNENISVKSEASIGYVTADDRESEDIGRRRRNLHFRSPIIEGNFLIQYSFIKERIASRYAIRRGGIRNLINAYLFVGIGGFYFDPQTQYEGQWIKLQPLGTEGQGIATNPPKYSLFAGCFPVGIGAKYTLSKKWSIGLDVGLRYTTTDYIDDVGGAYYNFENELKEGNITYDDLHNEIVIDLADRHLDEEGNPALIKYETGNAIRAGINSDYKDTYTFVVLHLAMKLTRGRRGIPKF